MDSLSGHPSVDNSSASAPGYDGVVDVGTDERRMHVRAYNHWVSLLDGRDFPSIEDLEPASISDFSSHSVLLDFTAGRDNPATPFVGAAVREECDLDDSITHINQVPSRSLLSRLTDHYMQIIANRAPIGFEAEFVNQREHEICYRGILMPFSSDGDTIDFIYGVINWKDVGERAPSEPIKANLPPSVEQTVEEPAPSFSAAATPEGHVPHLSWEDGPLAETEAAVIPVAAFGADDEHKAIAPSAADAGLADRLWAARESAEICKAADGRSRAALYKALAMAYDFSVAARRVPDEYTEILEDAGVKAQARAPMTPIAKLVFGADYDKSRLTEFASALSYAERCQVQFGDFESFLDRQDGGLKGMVAAERLARRPDKKPVNHANKARVALRQAPAIALSAIDGDEEFILVVSRRRVGGGVGYEAIGLVEDQKLVDRAIRSVRP
ncbi:MAG: hypothetical protein ABI667_04140 [Sphingomicrobium sp.]